MSEQPGIAALILAEHEHLRLYFTGLEEASGQEELSNTWDALSELLEAHAEADEQVLYPVLGRDGSRLRGERDNWPEGQNKIRDAIQDADAARVGSDLWWEAVGRARAETAKHLAVEERGPTSGCDILGSGFSE